MSEIKDKVSLPTESFGLKLEFQFLDFPIESFKSKAFRTVKIIRTILLFSLAPLLCAKHSLQQPTMYERVVGLQCQDQDQEWMCNFKLLVNDVNHRSNFSEKCKLTVVLKL